jgi:uncharacterized protein YndB with AHSA1/START domain
MEIQHELEIRRDPAEVFAFLTDPQQLPAWQPNTVAVRREREGELVRGERFEEVHRTFGRELVSAVEVAELESPRLFALRILSGPLPLDGRWTLTPSMDGTLLAFTGEVAEPGLLRLAKPLLARQFRGYHRRLKELLEQ